MCYSLIKMYTQMCNVEYVTRVRAYSSLVVSYVTICVPLLGTLILLYEYHCIIINSYIINCNYVTLYCITSLSVGFTLPSPKHFCDSRVRYIAMAWYRVVLRRGGFSTFVFALFFSPRSDRGAAIRPIYEFS